MIIINERSLRVKLAKLAKSAYLVLLEFVERIWCMIDLEMSVRSSNHLHLHSKGMKPG